MMVFGVAQRRRVIHGAADRNAAPPSNPRSKQTTKKPPATEASTVPQVQFLSPWTARSTPAIRDYPGNRADDARKRFGPSVPARAKSAFHLKDPCFGLQPPKDQIIRRFERLPGRRPGDRISHTQGLRRLLESLKAKLQERPTSCDACDDGCGLRGSRSGTELDPRRRRWIEQ